MMNDRDEETMRKGDLVTLLIGGLGLLLGLGLSLAGYAAENRVASAAAPMAAPYESCQTLGTVNQAAAMSPAGNPE